MNQPELERAIRAAIVVAVAHIRRNLPPDDPYHADQPEPPGQVEISPAGVLEGRVTVTFKDLRRVYSTDATGHVYVVELAEDGQPAATEYAGGQVVRSAIFATPSEPEEAA